MLGRSSLRPRKIATWQKLCLCSWPTGWILRSHGFTAIISTGDDAQWKRNFRVSKPTFELQQSRGSRRVYPHLRLTRCIRIYVWLVASAASSWPVHNLLIVLLERLQLRATLRNSAMETPMPELQSRPRSAILSHVESRCCATGLAKPDQAPEQDGLIRFRSRLRWSCERVNPD